MNKLIIVIASTVLLALGVSLVQDHFNTVPYNNCPVTTNDTNAYGERYTEYTCRDHVYYVR